MDWQQRYQHHVTAVKQQETDIQCHEGIKGVWLNLSECISGPTQITGFFLVLAAIVLLPPAGWSNYKPSADTTLSTYFSIPFISFIVNVLSLTGALLSMQMILVVAYDLAAVVVDVVTALVVVLVRTSRHFGYCQSRQHYARICDDQSQLAATHASACKVLCFAALPMTILTLLGTARVADSMESRRELDAFTGEKHSTKNNNSFLHELLIILGYAMGSIACFAQWAIQCRSSWLNQNSPGEESSNQTTETLMSSRAILVLSDVLYVVGVLLQSGGWMVVMVTLPWTIKSSIRACAHSNNICISIRTYRANRKYNNDDDSDVISVSESGSDTSNILWDQAWKSRCVHGQFTYYEELKPKPFDNAVLRLINQEVSTNSDWSSTSDEQELEWENETIAPFHKPMTETQYRFKQLNLASTEPRLIPLTLTIPESCDQRVITWISNSTPEEEKTPHLTMTLNLDLSIQNNNNNNNNDILKINEQRTYLPMSPRKNSL